MTVHRTSVFCSGPIGEYKSWEVFSPIERSEIVVEKLHLKFDIKPPGYPEQYQAKIGDISWLADWEVAVLGGSSLWTVHQKLLAQTQFLSTLGEGSEVLIDNEFKAFHKTLRLIGQYPELCAKVSFCRNSRPISHDRLSKRKSVRPQPSPECQSSPEPGEDSCDTDCELCAANKHEYSPPPLSEAVATFLAGQLGT